VRDAACRPRPATDLDVAECHFGSDRSLCLGPVLTVCWGAADRTDLSTRK
jgi:hypothetical protein